MQKSDDYHLFFENFFISLKCKISATLAYINSENNYSRLQFSPKNYV